VSNLNTPFVNVVVSVSPLNAAKSIVPVSLINFVDVAADNPVSTVDPEKNPLSSP